MSTSSMIRLTSPVDSCTLAVIPRIDVDCCSNAVARAPLCDDSSPTFTVIWSVTWAVREVRDGL